MTAIDEKELDTVLDVLSELGVNVHDARTGESVFNEVLTEVNRRLAEAGVTNPKPERSVLETSSYLGVRTILEQE
jgi:hypothetical protein